MHQSYNVDVGGVDPFAGEVAYLKMGVEDGRA
jgi:hypothetical protein